MLRHFANRLFGKGSALARHSDEDSRFHVADDIEERDPAFRLPPALHFLLFACVRSLLGLNMLAAFCNQAVEIDRVEARACLLSRDALVLNELRQQVGDAQACTSEANDHDLLLLQWNAGYIDCGYQGCGSDGRGALNIVVEGA